MLYIFCYIPPWAWDYCLLFTLGLPEPLRGNVVIEELECTLCFLGVIVRFLTDGECIYSNGEVVRLVITRTYVRNYWDLYELKQWRTELNVNTQTDHSAI